MYTVDGMSCDTDIICIEIKHRTLFFRVKEKIPTSKEVDPLAEIDRNSRKLEMILGNTPVLTIGDLRKFLPCSISLDPYLRKLIKGDNA